MAQPTPRNYAHRGHHKQYAPLTHSKPQKHMVSTAVLTQSKPVSNNDVRPVSVALPNILVTRPRHTHQVVTKFKLPLRRHITRSPSSRTSNLPPRVTAVQAPVVSAAQGNMSYLSDFKELNRGYVAFGGKQHRASCKTKPVSYVDQPLFRLHMDLFIPTFVKILNKKIYCLVIIDDYSRFTLVFFLATKDETTPILKTFLTGLENQLSLKVKVIKSDNGTEFKNSDFNQFCGLKGIKREFSNRVLVTKPHNKTPYELLHSRTPSIGFMRPFGCLVTILNTLDPLGKFQGNVDEGFLVGYSICSKAFRVFNSRTRIIQRTLHVNFLENKPNVAGTGPTWLFDIDSLTRTMNYQPVHAGNQTNFGAGFQDNFDAKKAGEEVDQSYMLFLVWFVGFINPQNNAEDAAFDGKEQDFDVKKLESKVILSSSSKFEDCSENISNEVNAASSIILTVGQNSLNSTNTFSTVGPSNDVVSLKYGKNSDINASQLFDDSDMPELEDIIYSDDEDVVGAEVDFNNLESSIPVSHILTTRIHKHHLVSQIINDLSSTTQTRSMTRAVKDQGGLSQMFGNDFQTSRIEAIRLFLAYASFMSFMVYQMDVKSAFLYGTIKEEVYVFQPLWFEDLDHPDKVKQKKDGIFISQDKYVAEILRKFGLTKEKLASTPIDTEKPLLKDPNCEDVDVHTYSANFFSRGISLTQQWEHFFTSSGKVLWQWELYHWQWE
nr:hypothetical protein [Tanacetum cinerariifolium]